MKRDCHAPMNIGVRNDESKFMRKSSKLILRQILSELLINLAAGWYGAAIIIPISSLKPTVIDLSALTADIVFGTVCIIVSFKLRIGIIRLKNYDRFS